ncbi:hypothetical protein ACG2OD_09180 [Streptomyces sp. PDY-4]
MDDSRRVAGINPQFLYQGESLTAGGPYSQLPWRPGVLTLRRCPSG